MAKTVTYSARRRLEAAATRMALLTAARKRFAHETYDRVGLREIAVDANADAALVTRYFGSKEALLEEVLSDSLYPSVLTDGDRATFGRRLMAVFADGQLHEAELEYFLLLLRVATVPSLQPMLKRVVYDRLMLPFTGWLGGPDAPLRSKLIHTLLCGASMQTLLAGPAPLSAADTERYRNFLSWIVQELIDGHNSEGFLGLIASAPLQTDSNAMGRAADQSA